MGITELLAQLADPATIKTLSLAQKMTASLVVTLLGMGVTFTALIILQLIISLLARFTAPPLRKTALQPPAINPTTKQEGIAVTSDDELVAVITAAIAMYPQVSQGNITICNIRKIETHVPAWSRAGVLDQMNSRF